VRQEAAHAFVLEVVGGPGARSRIPLDEPLDIGRDPSTGLALEDDSCVSHAHARLEPLVDGVVVHDLGSRNGTFVNGHRIEGHIIAGPGDRIVVGSTVFELRDADALAVPTRGRATSPLHSRWTFVLASTALFMAVLDNLVVLFALPSIQQDLSASVQQLEWTVNAFTLAFAVFLITGAALGDRFGRRRVFVIGISLFTAASALCALAPSIELFLIGRAIQGTGAAMITPLSLTILSAAFPAEKRGLILGSWSGIAGLAISLGPVVGGAIATGISWPWIFWLNVPIGAVVAPLCAVRLRESFGPYDRLDLPGVALVSTGLFGIVFGLVRGSAVGWTAGEVIAALVAGVLLTGAFLAWELRSPRPMLPLHLFKRRAVAVTNAASFSMYFGLFGSIFLLSQFLQVAQGYSALEAGVRALPWTAMPIIVAPIAGVLASRIGGGPLMAAGLALEAGSLTWLALLLDPHVAYVDIVGAFVLGGVGMGLFFAPAAIVILGSVRLEEEGQASGANNAIRELGGVFGVAVLATIFSSYGSYASPRDFTDGVIPPTWLGAVVLGLGALLALAVPRTRRSEHVASMTATLPAAGGMMPGGTLPHPVPTSFGATAPSRAARPAP
jgi:EmrB/QacA subfamily drug resistance transporter